MVSQPELRLADRAALTPYLRLREHLEVAGLVASTGALAHMIDEQLAIERHGKLGSWLQAIGGLPQIEPSASSLGAVISVGERGDLTDEEHATVASCLRALIPWRKGPLALFGVRIEAEWRSDLKWQRLSAAIAPLRGRTVLDVGASNGYYAWRMAGAGAKLVLGAEPNPNYVAQYLAFARYLPEQPTYVLPCRVEALPRSVNGFDTLFSMGVLYHQRRPFEHLSELHRRLRPGGELVLETLVVPDGHQTLRPKDRYARMRNVWLVPTVDELLRRLEESGFQNVRLIDVTPTTSDEQRTTPWMPFESLVEALDPDDHTSTIEGHPAPRRAILLASR